MGIVLQGIENGSAIGSTIQVGVTADGKLMVDAAVTVGSITANTGSQAYLFGKSGTDYYPLLSTSGADGGVLRIDGSISATTGSQAYLWAKSGTHYGELTMKSGADNILRVAPDLWTGIGSVLVTGSVNVATPIAWTGVGSVLVNGSINVTNMIGSVAVTSNTLWTGVGSILTQNPVNVAPSGVFYSTITNSGTAVTVIGSFAQTNNSLWTGVGSVLVNGSVNVTNMIGSVAVTSSQLWAGVGSVLVTGSVNVTSPIAWTGVGSVLVNGSVNVTNAIGSVAVTNTVATSGTSKLYGLSGTDWYPLLSTSGTAGGVLRIDGTINATTGSTAYLFGKSGADYYPLLSTSGADGGVLRIDGSISATTGSQAYLWGKSGTFFGELSMISGTNNLLRVKPEVWEGVGSAYISHGDEFGDATNELKVALGDSSGNRIGENNNPLMVSLEQTTSTNAVPVTVTHSGTAIATSGISKIYGLSGTDWYPLLSTSGTAGGVLRIDGSISATTGSQAYLWAKSGTFYGELGMVSGTENILRVRPDLWLGVGSVLVTGSVNVTSPIAWTGVGSVLVNGSVNVTNMIGSVAVTTNPLWTGIGSVLVTGSVNVTNMIGSVAVTSNTLWTGIGSTLLAGGSITNMPAMTKAVAKTLFNGAISISSGTNVAIISGQAGSDIYVYGYKIVFTTGCQAKFTGYSDLEGAQNYAMNGGVVEMTEPPYYLFKTASVGSAIGMSLTAGSAGGRINYWFG